MLSEAIGMTTMANCPVPIEWDGQTYELRGLTLRQWGAVMAHRTGMAISAYVAATEDPDPKQLEDLLLDCTYWKDLAARNTDELALLVSVSTGLPIPRVEALCESHPNAIITILSILSFGSAPKASEGEAETEGEWMDVSGLFASMLLRGLHPSAVLDMTFAQISAIHREIQDQHNAAA